MLASLHTEAQAFSFQIRRNPFGKASPGRTGMWGADRIPLWAVGCTYHFVQGSFVKHCFSQGGSLATQDVDQRMLNRSSGPLVRPQAVSPHEWQLSNCVPSAAGLTFLVRPTTTVSVAAVILRWSSLGRESEKLRHDGVSDKATGRRRLRLCAIIRHGAVSCNCNVCPERGTSPFQTGPHGHQGHRLIRPLLAADSPPPSLNCSFYTSPPFVTLLTRSLWTLSHSIKPPRC